VNAERLVTLQANRAQNPRSTGRGLRLRYVSEIGKPKLLCAAKNRPAAMTQKRYAQLTTVEIVIRIFPKLQWIGLGSPMISCQGEKKPSCILVGESWQQATGFAKSVYLSGRLSGAPPRRIIPSYSRRDSTVTECAKIPALTDGGLEYRQISTPHN
jgi:hypothetical protein